jgi:hypothetical protein
VQRGDPAVCNVSFNREGKDEMGAADKSEYLAGCESLHRQLPVFGRLAYLVRAEATKHDRPGRKSPNCPAGVFAAVGTIEGSRETLSMGFRTFGVLDTPATLPSEQQGSDSCPGRSISYRTMNREHAVPSGGWLKDRCNRSATFNNWRFA